MSLQYPATWALVVAALSLSMYRVYNHFLTGAGLSPHMLELRNLTKWYATPRGRRYVFRDLDFVFPPDASIGLIGRNGAGKSTLLSLLGGIDMPNAGAVITDARISWPVGLSGGFDTALTARENVQFVCRVHGATGRNMRRIVDFIADFAEIGEYFDMPMNSYSWACARASHSA